MTAAGRYLFEVQARAERAPVGPWTQPGSYLIDGAGNVLGELMLGDVGAEDFMIAARTDVPRLVAALRAALDVANDLHSAPGITDRRTVAEVLRGRIEEELTR